MLFSPYKSTNKYYLWTTKTIRQCVLINNALFVVFSFEKYGVLKNNYFYVVEKSL